MIDHREIPIAMSMIDLVDISPHSFQKYSSLWTAFNNIYVLLSNRQGLRVTLSQNKNSQNGIDYFWNYCFPKVKTPPEKEQIRIALKFFNPEIKDRLIRHPNIPFFIERTPAGVQEKFDHHGQEINGVLNLTRSIFPDVIIWSPINRIAYQDYLNGNASVQQLLVEQIVFMLYTIRNNLDHGGKNPSDANDTQVIEMALPILREIVDFFIVENETEEEIE